ncbi:hypothetical protein ACIPX0_18415 [Streptomyces sp. NPDC090075]|uniref:hypothetical protein n=1 Tax=unclassified Streptomyces TaxID=2593676 RepID=UPI0033D051D2
MDGRHLPAAGTVTAVLLGAAGALAAYLAGAGPAAALPAGAGIGLLVWTAHLVTDRVTGRPGTDAGTGEPPGPGSTRAKAGRAGSGPAGSEPPADARRWLNRASNAARKLDRHRRDSADPALTEALTTAVGFVRTAADELRARAEAVRVIDAATEGTDHAALRGDQRRLEEEARALRGAVREAKEASARAIGERAASLERLAGLREVLMATLESTVLRLEAAADRGSLLVSLHAAGDAAMRAADLTFLEHELEAVQAGLDRLDELGRSVHDTGTAPGEAG